MTINSVPDRGNVLSKEDRTGQQRFEVPWIEFFRSTFYALFGWRRSFTALLSFNFGNIVAGGELTTTVAVAGARQGDAVIVTPKTAVAGLGADGIVTANDVVTVRRFNFSTAGINPAADDFRVVVLQQ